LLQEGDAVVWLLLTGSDAAENERAEKVVKEMVAAAASGKLMTGEDADAAPAPAQAPPNEEGAAAPGKGLKLGLVKVAQTDAAETWLVRTLMAIDPDLKELSAQPMLFAVYGRGRAMPPCVGQGISTENLMECLEFLTGPCSCMIKDDNPGVDLLMRWDWEATAEAMAALDEQMGGGPPEESEPVANKLAGGPATAGKDDATAPPSDAAGSSGKAEDSPSAKEPSAQEAEAAAAVAAGEASLSPQEEHPVIVAESFAGRLAWTIGIGLAVGGIVVVVLGVMLVRFQRPG
jgi:hypothetical protein